MKTKFVNILAMISLAGFTASAQTANPATPVPSVPVSITALAYPGPAVTATVNSVAEIQFEVIVNGTRYRDLTKVPVSMRWTGYGLASNPRVSCDTSSGRCKVASDKPGAVIIGVYDPTGNWGYYGGNVTINFLPEATSSIAFRETQIPVVVSTIQGTEHETLTAWAVMPKDYAGTASLEFNIQGQGKSVFFPAGVKAGQRVEIGKFEVLPQSELGTQNISVTLIQSQTGMALGRGNSTLAVKSGYRQFEAKLDDRGNLVVSGNLPSSIQYQLVLLRGDNFYFPLSSIQYPAGGTAGEIVAYNGSQAQGSEYLLPMGYYSVAVIGVDTASIDGWTSSVVLTNAIYLDATLSLK